MTLFSRLLVPVCLIAAALTCAPALAEQDGVGVPPPPPAQAADAPSPPAVRHTFDLDFPGGTLEEYLKSIERAHGSFTNVVITDPEVLHFQVMPVHLRQINTQTAMQLIQTIGKSRDSKQYVSMSPGQGVGGVYILGVGQISERARVRLPLQTRAFDLQPIQARSKDNSDREMAMLLDAIGVGIALGDLSDDFVTKIHPASGLLFVRGTAGQLSLVEEILALKSGSGAPPARPAPPPQPEEPPAPAQP